MLKTHPFAHLLGLPKRKPGPKVSTPQPPVLPRAAKAKPPRESFDHLRVAARSRAAERPPTPKPTAPPKSGSAGARAVASYRKALGDRAREVR